MLVSGNARKVEKREDRRARVSKNCNEFSPKLHVEAARERNKNDWLNASPITELLKVSTRGNFQVPYIRWVTLTRIQKLLTFIADSRVRIGLTRK